MTAKNAYATIAQFINFVPQMTTNTVNTAGAEIALEAASRRIDNETGRKFYPRILADLYDVPTGRELTLHDDLLEVLGITNGDGAAITNTDYKLLLYGITPYRWIRINAGSTAYWTSSITTGTEAAISINAFWGYHSDYVNAWMSGSTLNGAISSTTATSVPVTSGTPFAAGQVVRVDNELLTVTVVSTNTLTVERGANGSTAATHLTLAPVTIWRSEIDATNACLILAHRYYKRNNAPFGSQGGGDMGVQIADIPLDPDVKRFVDTLKWRL